MIGVQHKRPIQASVESLSKDESDMVLIGCVAPDAPKRNNGDSVGELMKERGVLVKVLTGDNELVTRSVW